MKKGEMTCGCPCSDCYMHGCIYQHCEEYRATKMKQMKKLTDLERYQLEQGRDSLMRVLSAMKRRRLNKKETDRMKLLEEAVQNCECVWIMK